MAETAQLPPPVDRDALLESARERLDAAIALRRTLHEHPELGLELPFFSVDRMLVRASYDPETEEDLREFFGLTVEESSGVPFSVEAGKGADLSFAIEGRLREEQREIGVLVTCRLEHLVQGGLHQFPDPIAVRPNDHATPDRGMTRQLRLLLLLPSEHLSLTRLSP